MSGRLRRSRLGRRPDQHSGEHHGTAGAEQGAPHDGSVVSQCSPIRMPFAPYWCGIGAWK